MPGGQVLSVNTSSARKSIWQGVDREQFRTNIVALQRASNQVPCDPKVHTRKEWHNPRIRQDDPSYVLPFEVEQRLADDFAFLAAAEEGVKAVSAVALEESLDPAGLTVRLAANETVPEHVPDTFKTIFSLLGRCAKRKLLPKPCAEDVFEHVVNLSQERIHGRLQSRRWIRPKHLSKAQAKPLHQELRKVSRELFERPPFTRMDFSLLMDKLNDLCDSYECMDIEWENKEQGVRMLKEIVRKSHDFCTSNGTCTLEETIRSLGLNPSLICADKRIQQVNKIGRYWGLCVQMAKTSKEYGKMFKDVNLRILQPYQSLKSSISFPAGKRVRCFVHAEIQLITFYGLHANAATRRPRILGVSKSACYLCSLFVLIQGHYFITKTHGHLYDHWNVPDLASYEPTQLADYRRVLSEMNQKVKNDLTKEKRGVHSRNHPLTSSVNLPKGQTFSPLHSEVGTLISNGSSNPENALTLPPIRSLVLPTEQQDSLVPRGESSVLNDKPFTTPKLSSSPLVQPKSTRASSPGPSTSFLLNKPPTTTFDIGASSQFPTAQNPKPLNPSSHGSENSTPSVPLLNKFTQPMTSVQRSSSPSAAPKSSSSPANDSDTSTPSPTSPKKGPHPKITSKRSSPQSTAPESSSSSSTNSYPPAPRVEPPLKNNQPVTSHPSSPPTKPNSAQSVLAAQLVKFSVTASHTRLSNSPVYSSTQKSRLLSSTSIASCQLPVLKDISRDSPLRVSAGKISTEIEFQGPGHGRVLVENVEDPGVNVPGTFVDIEALSPNDSLLLERAETDDEMALILQYRHRSLRLDIRWH
ncbi:hypothetical protein MMC22_002538 [Lobaria immixta]|nr:hypothetical protein [Lobaria immixta]